MMFPRSYSAIADTACASLDRDGYTIVENLITPAETDRIRAEIDPWFGITPRCKGHFYGYRTTRFGRVPVKSPTSAALITHPAMLEIVDRILGPHCDWAQLNLTQAVRIHPGAPQQPVHRDDEMWPISPKPHEFLINVMWAVDDFTAANGATRIWPGSHRGDLTREPPPEDAIIADMPRGSALIFTGSVLHCGGANSALSHRSGLIFSYSLGWLKAYENPFLSYPPEVARHFAPDLQTLCGYRIHRPNLGGYENTCPSVLLQDGDTPDALAAEDCLPPEIEAQLREIYEEA